MSAARPETCLILLPDLAGGGAQRVLLEVARRLDRAALSPDVAVLNADGPLASLVPSDAALEDLQASSVRRGWRSLRRLIAQKKPAAILSTMGYFNMAVMSAAAGAAPRGCRIILREANTLEATRRELGRGAAALGYRFLYPRAHAVLCNSKAVCHELGAAGVPRARIEMLPNPVDVEALRDSARAGTFAAPPTLDRPHFVASGRLRRQKGFDRLLDWFAAAGAPGRLTILGDGPDEEALRRRANAPDLVGRVTFLGFVDRPAPIVSDGDVFLLPSRWEGMPNAALEALALGVPVLAHCEAGGVGELAAAAPAHAVTVTQNGAAFVEGLKRAASSVRSERGMRGSLLPQRYEAARVVARYQALLLGDPPAGAPRENDDRGERG